MKEQKGKVNCNGGFEIHYITDEDNKEGKLFKYRRWIDGTFYIRAKTKEEASEWVYYIWENEDVKVDSDELLSNAIAECVRMDEERGVEPYLD